METRIINTNEIIDIVDGKYAIPEKIYIPQNLTGIEDFWIDHKVFGNEIEYTRTDAFIEKACEFIKDHHEFSFWNTEEHELGFNTQRFIDDFKNYMKGE